MIPCRSRADYYAAGYSARMRKSITRDCPYRGGWQRGYWLKGWGDANRTALHPRLYPHCSGVAKEER